MAKAVFTRRFDATDTTKGISIRIYPASEPQTYPEWVIAKAERAGAATRITTQKAAVAVTPKEN